MSQQKPTRKEEKIKTIKKLQSVHASTICMFRKKIKQNTLLYISLHSPIHTPSGVNVTEVFHPAVGVSIVIEKSAIFQSLSILAS